MLSHFVLAALNLALDSTLAGKTALAPFFVSGSGIAA
jgi:hypothetical protein